MSSTRLEAVVEGWRSIATTNDFKLGKSLLHVKRQPESLSSSLEMPQISIWPLVLTNVQLASERWAVANQEPERLRSFWQRPRQLPACCVTHSAFWIRRVPCDVHTAAAQFDEEEHVQPLQPDRLHGEEI